MLNVHISRQPCNNIQLMHGIWELNQSCCPKVSLFSPRGRAWGKTVTGGQLHSINCQMLNCFVTQSLRLFASQYFEQDVMLLLTNLFSHLYFEQGIMFCGIFFPVNIWSRVLWFADESFFGRRYFEQGVILFCPRIFFAVNISSGAICLADNFFLFFWPSIFRAGCYVLPIDFSLSFGCQYFEQGVRFLRISWWP